jgi:hypothetical protein
VSAAALNVIAVGPATAGYLTMYPSGQTRPMASTLNFVKGQVIANFAMARLSASGSIDIYNGSGGPIDIVVDVSGYVRS